MRALIAGLPVTFALWSCGGTPPPAPPPVPVAEPVEATPVDLAAANTQGNPLASIVEHQERLFWRLPGTSSCQEWKMSGKQTGALTRVDVKPALALRYAFANDDNIIIRGDRPTQAALGENSLGVLCDDRFEVKALEDNHIEIGSGVWHRNRESCEQSNAAVAPASCVSTLAAEVRETSNDPDLLRYVFDKNGPLTTLGFAEGRLSCQHWRFRDGQLVRRLEHQDGSHTEVSYAVKLKEQEAWVAGPTYKDGQGAMGAATDFQVFPLERVSRDLALVGGNPWFVSEPLCERLLAASTRKVED